MEAQNLAAAGTTTEAPATGAQDSTTTNTDSSSATGSATGSSTNTSSSSSSITGSVTGSAVSTSSSSATTTNTGDLSHAVDIGWLKLDKAEFYEGAGGFTGLRYEGKEYKRVQLRRAMPDRYPSDYISVADNENKEIGMIRSIADLPDNQLRIVSDELDRRYYCPEILDIKSVRDKLGYVYMEMEVMAGGERHERSAAINDVNKNIRMLGSNRLIIFDVDGNRFIVNALDKLDGKSLRRLEPYMF